MHYIDNFYKQDWSYRAKVFGLMRQRQVDLLCILYCLIFLEIQEREWR